MMPDLSARPDPRERLKRAALVLGGVAVGALAAGGLFLVYLIVIGPPPADDRRVDADHWLAPPRAAWLDRARLAVAKAPVVQMVLGLDDDPPAPPVFPPREEARSLSPDDEARRARLAAALDVQEGPSMPMPAPERYRAEDTAGLSPFPKGAGLPSGGGTSGAFLAVQGSADRPLQAYHERAPDAVGGSGDGGFKPVRPAAPPRGAGPVQETAGGARAAEGAPSAEGAPRYDPPPAYAPPSYAPDPGIPSRPAEARETLRPSGAGRSAHAVQRALAGILGPSANRASNPEKEEAAWWFLCRQLGRTGCDAVVDQLAGGKDLAQACQDSGQAQSCSNAAAACRNDPACGDTNIATILTPSAAGVTATTTPGTTTTTRTQTTTTRTQTTTTVPSPSPSPTQSPSPTPSPSPSPRPSPAPSPTASLSPRPSPTPSPTSVPSPRPSPSPTATPRPTPSPSPRPSPSPTPTPTPTP
ncbi:MAG: hypothetical protein HY553_08050 [Elusimicrobia bacterium]|nr:hypothetical protein [Elusimicrobiota bacterium]